MTGSARSHERLARALLRLYPAPFRARFGDDLLQLTGDLLRDARAGRAGSPGVLGTWLHVVLDVARTAPLEHLDQRRVARSLSRPATAITKALGVLGILGGLILVAGYIPNIDWRGFFILRLILFNAGAIAIAIAVLRRQGFRPRLLWLATAAVVVGNAWYGTMIVLSIGRPQFPEPDPTFRPIFFAAGIALWLGPVLFGLVALWLRAGSRLASLAIAVGSFVAFLGMGQLAREFPWLAGVIELTAPVHLWGVAIAGAGWILMGVDLATRRRPAQALIPAPPDPAEARTAEQPG